MGGVVLSQTMPLSGINSSTIVFRPQFAFRAGAFTPFHRTWSQSRPPWLLSVVGFPDFLSIVGECRFCRLLNITWP